MSISGYTSYDFITDTSYTDLFINFNGIDIKKICFIFVINNNSMEFT